MMATAVNERNLDDKSLFPVYAKCEELGWPIFLHPINPLGGERMRSYNMRNLLGNPVEFIESLDLTARERELILGGNAARLFKL